MAAKKDIQVLIGGKIYTLSGYESEEYLQKIALYINNKMEEMDQIPNYRRLGVDMQKTLLELNMADDYHKAKKQVEEDPLQISLFGSGDSEKEALLDELKGLSVMEMTPLQAMQTLYDLQNKAKNLG